MFYVFTDLHGDKRLWDKIKTKFSNPSDTLIFLGDACDRGKDGYAIIKEMLDTPNLVYLLGNHEDIFVKAALALARIRDKENFSISDMKNINIANFCYDHDVRLCYLNGGESTLKHWIQDAMSLDVVEKLKNLPITYSIEDTDFCHAGCLQADWEEKDKDLLVWCRDHFKEEWFEGRFLVHGHTPNISEPFCAREGRGPIIYANESKINMDTYSIGSPHGYVLQINGDEMQFIKVDKE